LSTTTELDQLHELIGGLRRCVTSLASRYGDSAAMRRIVNDAERIQNDIDRLDIDAEELNLARGVSHHHHTAEKIGIPDTQYASDFWQDDGPMTSPFD
jgi:nitrogen-specific signal transduction histidine kinase